MLNLTRKNSGSSHSYKIDGLWAPGATTVIDACSPKRLDGWAARLAAAHADEHWERLSSTSPRPTAGHATHKHS